MDLGKASEAAGARRLRVLWPSRPAAGIPSPSGRPLVLSWPVLLPVALLVAMAASFLVDCPVAQWCLGEHCPKDLVKVLSLSEVFGHGLGVLLVAIVIWQLDAGRRWAIPRLLAAAYSAGLAADLCKMLVVRIRPHHFDFHGSVASTFGPWLPLHAAGGNSQSFPSGHVATAAGLAVALVWLYPRGRWLFVGLVMLVACQRIETGAHYLSDTLGGAALGLVMAGGCVHFGFASRWFDRLESRWKRPAISDTPTVSLERPRPAKEISCGKAG